MSENNRISLLNNPTRHLFFTGKGGVGKTSLACAVAIALADRGKRVLLVSTDPASNLEHVFETEIGRHEPTALAGAENLYALNIDPEEAARKYREKVVGPARGSLPEETVRSMEEQLSGACTTEIAAFDEFTALLADPESTAEFDHVVFDTAPTGHTLRLLTLPSAWSGFLETSQSDTSCLGPLAGLEKQRQQYKAAVDSLADGELTTLVLVSRPQAATLKEAARTSEELAALNILNQQLAINGVLPAVQDDDPLAAAMAENERRALAEIPEKLRDLETNRIPLQAHNLIGTAALRSMLQTDQAGSFVHTEESLPPPESLGAESLKTMTDRIEADGPGLVMVMGKGGVGKTTIAAAVAAELARRGNDVHLSTTDPAAHVADAIDAEAESLTVSRIDPAEESERYRREVLETKGKDMDEEERKLLEEDLRSPCTEEIAVFQAFSRKIREARRRFVIMDTAPTGHTLLLLDATGSYHREVMRHASEGTRVTTPLMRLQDPRRTKILIVTLPETTPVLEAAALQEDLRRAGINPWGWVINSSLLAARPEAPFLVARAKEEMPRIKKVQSEYCREVAMVPWLPEEPKGAEKLLT